MKKKRGMAFRFVAIETTSYDNNPGPYVADIWSRTCNCSGDRRTEKL
jgi:hypothetical protein